jgi:uncharacterized protein YqcC (DUF446 family)
MSKQSDYEIVSAKLDEIESEMKRIGLWQNEPLHEEQYDFRGAFGMDTMAFNQWLQFIFIPRVREIIAQGGEFPSKSEVGAQAFREFIAYPSSGDNTEKLVSLLNEFDALFGN